MRWRCKNVRTFRMSYIYGRASLISHAVFSWFHEIMNFMRTIVSMPERILSASTVTSYSSSKRLSMYFYRFQSADYTNA